jgi:hypothetical protein
MMKEIFKKTTLYLVIPVLIVTAGLSCRWDKPKTATIHFHLELNRDVYMDTLYGEPPQIAIWIENPQTGEIRNVWVTYRSGKNEWVGKVSCDVCLPYWQSRLEKAKARTEKPNPADKLDAVTAATPKDDSINASITVPSGSRWMYYIEVNVSGDFNEAFPMRHPQGYPDMAGNGQPSLIYKGEITAEKNNEDSPELAGRTDQWQPVDHIIKEIEGITTAKNLLGELKATCR